MSCSHYAPYSNLKLCYLQQDNKLTNQNRPLARLWFMRTYTRFSVIINVQRMQGQQSTQFIIVAMTFLVRGDLATEAAREASYISNWGPAKCKFLLK
jgi:hypothetical protein